MVKIGRYSEVHASVKMSDNSEIGMYCVVGKNVILGQNVTIGNYCQIEEGTVIGDNTILQGSVKTGKNCRIGQDVVLKWGVILTTHVTVGHNVFMGARAVTLGSNAQRETEHGTTIGNYAYIGAGALIDPKMKIATGVVIGALSYVKNHINTEWIKYVGIPAKQIK